MDVPSGTATITIMDVARRAEVSRTTASRVLNDAADVSPQARQRVQAAIAELGYRPNPAAQALAAGRPSKARMPARIPARAPAGVRAVIELVVVDDHPDRFGTNPYYGRVVAGIVSAIGGTPAQMRVHIVALAEVAGLLDRIAADGTLGALLVNVPAALAEQAHRHGTRVVSLGRSGDGVPAVEPDNEAGAYAAVSHLQREGRRRIAAIHGPQTNPDATARRDGYLGAMRDAGLPPVDSDGEFRREVGYRQARLLLAEHPDLDAIFVACDLMATGALQALAESGRRVPDDVAVVGFDDSGIAACSSPPMTSVHQPVEEMAAAATRALLDGLTDPHWHAVFPVQLVVRRSSG